MAIHKALMPSFREQELQPLVLSRFLSASKTVPNMRKSSRFFTLFYAILSSIKVASLPEQIVKQRVRVQEKVPALFQVLRV